MAPCSWAASSQAACCGWAAKPDPSDGLGTRAGVQVDPRRSAGTVTEGARPAVGTGSIHEIGPTCTGDETPGVFVLHGRTVLDEANPVVVRREIGQDATGDGVAELFGTHALDRGRFPYRRVERRAIAEVADTIAIGI
jgi:hypothetical protein